MAVDIGHKVPDFLVKDDQDNYFGTNDLLGKWTVMYFYPKDNTPGCTQESCDFRDRLSVLKKAGAQVVGISKDSVASHKKFKEKYYLPFPLLSDEDGKLCGLFDIVQEKSLFGRKYMGIVRSTYLVDPEAIVRQVWRKVRVRGHVEDVLVALNDNA
jgi:thioredoxin-dependent peroxiredoxin